MEISTFVGKLCINIKKGAFFHDLLTFSSHLLLPSTINSSEGGIKAT